jgi:superfamily II DNA or RNA helicase
VELREYQQTLVQSIREKLLQGKRRICVVLGCGGGKSICQGYIAKNATERGNRVLFLVHRKELCGQIRETFEKVGVDFSLCKIGMVQTVVNNLENEPEPDIIITDESHHVTSKSYMDIHNKFNKAIMLGFTATPIRLDGKGLKVYEDMVEGVTVPWLIENKYLADYVMYGKPLADASNIKTVCGDYKQDAVAELMEDKVIYGKTVENYKLLADGKKAIVYCASIDSSCNTAEEFNRSGIIAVHLDAKSKQKDRADALQKFRDGEIKVLCNVDLFSEGLDVPDCECVIMLRPTKSLTLYIQQSMRCMRYKEDKRAVIIDHVKNAYNHGLPDDLRKWDLSGNKREKRESFMAEMKIKGCPECFSVGYCGAKFCRQCGHKFIADDRSNDDIKVVDIELQIMTRESILVNKPYGHYKKIKIFEDMVEFGKVKGRHRDWAFHRCLELDIYIPEKYNKTVERVKSYYKHKEAGNE